MSSAGTCTQHERINTRGSGGSERDSVVGSICAEVGADNAHDCRFDGTLSGADRIDARPCQRDDANAIDAVPWPFALATDVPAPTANPLTEKLALAAPAAIVTELGALSAAPLAVNVTVTALDAAEGRLIVYVPIPPTSDRGRTR